MSELHQRTSFLKTHLRAMYLLDCLVLLVVIGILCARLPGLHSKAIGLTTTEWETTTKSYDPGIGDGVAGTVLDGNYLIAEFFHNKLWYLTIQPAETPLTIAQARALAFSYLPTDAKYLKEYRDPASTQPVYVYSSRGILLRFNSRDQMWQNASSTGQILVSLLTDTNNPNQVFSIDVIVGSEQDTGKP